ncbi:hypothetical protein [Rubrivirga sp. IMCC45206]|uniref:hypothetical protein n=1 Tax=Rubrivirga sp. IMCC45206 TaxID=3391614 RepID=UPI00398FE41E
MGALADRVIAAAEARVGVSMPYLTTLADTSGAAFAKWMLAMPAADHRKAAPREAWHLARLGATVAQDCGTCVQVVVTVARRDGVGAILLRQALDAPETLSDDLREAYAFGHAVATQADDVADHVQAIEALFGHPAHVELAMAVAMCHIFPVIKRGLGQSLACALVTVEV